MIIQHFINKTQVNQGWIRVLNQWEHDNTVLELLDTGKSVLHLWENDKISHYQLDTGKSGMKSSSPTMGEW